MRRDSIRQIPCGEIVNWREFEAEFKLHLAASKDDWFMRQDSRQVNETAAFQAARFFLKLVSQRYI